MGNKGEDVILGFSGGADSCAAAARLAEDGWRVTALTLDMTGDGAIVAKARKQARESGLPLVVNHVSRQFSAVTDYFVESYAAGRTPAPCTLCNTAVKWPSLTAEADRRGIRHIATGHYFNTVRHNGHLYVSRADDRTKDQSYYLWGLTQPVMERIVTPMAHVFKSDIGRPEPNYRESMGVCFLNGEPYKRYLMQHRPATMRRGDIVDMAGRVIGHHDGTAFYTIGQRRGLGLEDGTMCIVAIDARHNRLVAGIDSQLYYHTLEVDACNIVDHDELLSSDDVSVVIRGVGRNPQGYMRRAELIGTRLRIRLDDPAWAPAAGQPAVFYRGDRVIGGGIVEKYF